MTAPHVALRLALAFGLHALTALAGNAMTTEAPQRPTPSALIITGEALLSPMGVNVSGGQSPHTDANEQGVSGKLDL